MAIHMSIDELLNAKDGAVVRLMPDDVVKFVYLASPSSEGSGECQSRSNVPDSAGATPAPSTNKYEVKQDLCEVCFTRNVFSKADGAYVCEHCFEELKYSDKRTAPVIEQKPVCMCCTKFHFPQDVGEEICHDDPCIYSHLERYMLPIARAQFRERQLAIRAAATRARLDAEDAAALQQIECSIYRTPSIAAHDIVPPNAQTYASLTGHKYD